MKPQPIFRSFLALTGSALLLASQAQAVIYYWDSNSTTGGFGSTSGIWGTSTFWSTSSAGTTATAATAITVADDVNFGTAANAYTGGTVTLSAAQTANSMTFGGSGAVTLLGDTASRAITLGPGGITMASGAGAVTLGNGTATQNVTITLTAGAQTWTNNSTNNFTDSDSAVALITRSAGSTLTFNQTSTGVFSLTTTQMPNVNSIVGNWAFFGTGTSQQYAFNNTGTIAGFTGSIQDSESGWTSNTTNYEVSTTTTQTLSGARTANTLRYSGTGLSIDTGSSGANTLTTNGILAVGSSGTLTIQRTGGTGSLAIGSSNELVIAGPQNVTISAPITGTSTQALTYAGTATLTLSGTNTYGGALTTGATTIASGTLITSGGTAIVDTGLVVLGNVSGTTFQLNNNETIGNLSGGGAVGGTVALQGNTLTLGDGNAQTYGGTFSGTSGAAIIKQGTGTLTLSGATQALTNITTTINAGTISYNGGSLTGGTINISNNAVMGFQPTGPGKGSVSAAGSGGDTISNNINISGIGTLAFQSNTSRYVMNGTIAGVSGNTILNIANGFFGGNAGDRNDPVFATVLADPTGGVLSLNATFASFGGSGGNNSSQICLTAQNTFTGPITITDTSSAAISTSGFGYLVIGGDRFINGSVSTSPGNGYLGTGGIYANTIRMGVSTALVYETTSAQTLSGVISGPGLLIKEASGNLTLSAANTFSGITSVTAGTLTLSNNLALQNSALNTTGAGTVTLGAGITTPTFGGLANTGTTRNLASIITSGYGNVTALTLNVGGGVGITPGAIVTSGTTLTAGTFTYSGIIADGAAGMSVTKTGAGTQIFSNTNTYTGGTNVNAGTLLLSGAFNMPGTGALTVNAGGNFSLADGTARTTTVNGGLIMASGSTMTFDWNAGAADSLTTTAAVNTTVGNIIGISINGTNTPTGGMFNLISSSNGGSTLNNASYYLANTTNYTATLTQSATSVTIGSYASATALTNIYWMGNKLAASSTSGVDNALAFSNGTTSNWSSTNTTYAGTALTPGSTANIIFSNALTGRAQQTTVLGADMTALSVTIDDSNAVTIGGSNSLTLLSTSTTAGTVAAPGAAISVTANAANPTISANVILGAGQAWNVASGKTLTVSGVISGPGLPGNAPYTLTANGAGTVILSGNNIHSGLTTVSGGGTLTLSGDNSAMSGGVALNGATASTKLNVNSATALGTGFFAINGGDNGTLDNSSGSDLTLTTNNNITLSNSFTFTGSKNLNMGTGIVTLGASKTITVSANSLTFGGSVVGSNSLTKAGNGTLVLSGSNMYTGATAINAGVLTLNGSNTFATGLTTLVAGTLNLGNANAIGGNGGLTISNNSAVLNNTSGGALTMNNVGTVTLSSNLAFTGSNNLTINSNVNHTTPLTITMNGTGNLTFGNYTNTGGVNQIINVIGSSNGTLTFNNMALSNSATSYSLQFGNNGAPNGKVVINGVVSDGGTATNSSLTIGGFSGSAATMTVTLNGANTYHGGTTLQSGTLNINNASAIGTGTLTIQSAGAGAVDTIDNTSGSAITLSTNNAQNWNTDFTFTGSNDLNMGTGSVTMNANRQVTVSGGNLTVGGAIGGGAFALTKSGTGTLTLTNTHSYTGATNVNTGTLKVNAGSINSTSAINVAAGGTLRYNSSTALTVAPTLAGNGTSNRAVLGGTGTINAAVTLDNLGDVLSPGNSPGVQNYAVGQTWSSFSYDWELNDWTAAVAGTNIDQITISGTLDLSAVTANQYILNILSLMNNNSSGLVGSGGGNLFSEANNSWTILTATTITGFNASEWSINAAGFTDNETGTWSISQSGNSLLLNYAAVPEPSVALLGGLSLLGLALRRRRN